MSERLLDELGSEDEEARKVATAAAAGLPPDALLSLLQIYFRRRADQTQDLQEAIKGSPRLRWLGPFKLLTRSHHFRILAVADRAQNLNRASANLASAILKMQGTEYRKILTYALKQCMVTEGSRSLKAACEAAVEKMQSHAPPLQPEEAVQLTDAQRALLLYPLVIVRDIYRERDRRVHHWPAGAYSPPVRFEFSHINLRYVREEALHALKLLQQIGDERDLELVRYLAHIKPRTVIAREIQQAAEECLPFIELRAHNNQLAKRLLRPSDATAATPDTLLRPATTGGETNASELLRSQSG